MTVSMPIARRATKCLVPGASAIYLFSEGSGTTLRDFSGNARDGTFGAAGAAPSYSATGIAFDTDEYIDMGTDAGLDLANIGHTLIVVVTPTTTGIEAIAGKSRLDTHSCGLAQVSGKFRFDFRGAGAANVIDANAAYATGTPYVVAVTRAASAISMYIDGTKQTSTKTVTDEPATGAYPFRLGSTPGGSSCFNGTIHAVLAYPFALSPAQFAQTHSALAGILAPRGVTLA